MDKLSELPPAETAMTPQENEVMKKYFGDSEPQSEKLSWAQIFKLAIYATILFVFLTNPIADGIFSKLPYCGDGVLTLLLTKSLIFMVLFISIYKFA